MKPRSIIELEEKVTNYKPKTNLMISEYKKQLQKIRNDKIGYYLFREITYIEIIK
jgi:inner membrane protein